MARYRRTISAILLVGGMAGCASHAPPLAADHTAVVRGRQTAGLSPAEATRTVLVGAARLTVDHGFQYFRIVRAGYGGAISPGTDVTIRLFLKDEVREGTPGVWDAQKILLTGVPPSAVATARAPAR
ncbi:MAG TPA: hypothetical protein VMU22_13990 [Rhizomicrobium sp.]|nr:hypothetical protein [Rhizomicrobium sp.]